MARENASLHGLMEFYALTVCVIKFQLQTNRKPGTKMDAKKKQMLFLIREMTRAHNGNKTELLASTKVRKY